MIEFGTGMSPLVADGPAIELLIVGGEIEVRYSRHSERGGVILRLESSRDLITWQVVPDSPESVAGAIETRKATVPLGADERLFFRLVASPQ